MKDYVIKDRHIMSCIPQGYGPAGEYAWMLEQCGLTAPQVTQQIVDAVL
ncbi:hypothetical protein [Cronobacter dublinensis]|nr:hypothetical protein [Cronobacter dublinensis]EKK4080507.1 hypothetical protein [Cronobacter dublinensis]EKK7716137.1 hypothetical protein [Cronobacter dublinensis]ELY3771226.1 hypothetical protein [Cronobacter dublinensis]MDI7491035.1 hypothetical protein [Cronobacter dublinensis]